MKKPLLYIAMFVLVIYGCMHLFAGMSGLADQVKIYRWNLVLEPNKTNPGSTMILGTGSYSDDIHMGQKYNLAIGWRDMLYVKNSEVHSIVHKPESKDIRLKVPATINYYDLNGDFLGSLTVTDPTDRLIYVELREEFPTLDCKFLGSGVTKQEIHESGKLVISEVWGIEEGRVCK